MHSPAQSRALYNLEPTTPAFLQKILAPDSQGYQLEPESTPKKLPQKTTNQKKNSNKKTQEGKLLAGLRPNNATWPVC